MRKYLLHVLIISLTLLPMLIGCYMYEPVSTMPTWQLQSEYDSLQIERGKLERKLQYGGGGYTSRTYTDTNIWTGEKEIKTKVTPVTCSPKTDPVVKPELCYIIGLRRGKHMPQK